MHNAQWRPCLNWSIFVFFQIHYFTFIISITSRFKLLNILRYKQDGANLRAYSRLEWLCHLFWSKKLLHVPKLASENLLHGHVRSWIYDPQCLLIIVSSPKYENVRCGKKTEPGFEMLEKFLKNENHMVPSSIFYSYNCSDIHFVNREPN